MKFYVYLVDIRLCLLFAVAMFSEAEFPLVPLLFAFSIVFGFSQSFIKHGLRLAVLSVAVPY